MRLLKRIENRYRRWIAHRASERLKSEVLIEGIDPDDFSESLRDPSTYYRRAYQDLHRTVPEELRSHREYFRIDQRGFGEDAFHVMWWKLFRRFKPEFFLEIGVYRGQVLSLIALLARLEGVRCLVTGISPFSSIGDSVSQYRNDLDYFEDTLAHFKHHGLQEPTLVKAFSTDPEAIAVIESRRWDMIYIDGNHDYDVVRQDWEACSNAVAPGGIIVLDDSGLTTSYRAPVFAKAGHPGPSRLASEIDPQRFREILQVGHNRVFQRLA